MKRFIRDFKGRFSLKGGKRLPPIEIDLAQIPPVQVNIGFFDLPGTVLGGGFRMLFRVRGIFHALLHSPAAGPVRPMPIFAVYVVGHDHIGLVFADHLRHVGQQPVLPPNIQAFRQGGHPLIPELLIGHFGIMPHAAVPQAVQRFHQPEPVHAGRIDHDHPLI